MFHGFWPFWFFWPFHGLLTLLLVILVVVLLVRHRPAPFAYPAGTGSPTPGIPPVSGRSEALVILESRYARGEIQRDEYLQKKADLGG